MRSSTSTAIAPPPKTASQVAERLEEQNPEITDWYFSKKKI